MSSKVDRVRADEPQQLRIRCAVTDVFVRDIPVSVVFLYEHALDSAALARGLARVLGDFTLFDARLTRRGLERFIECGGTGCRFKVRTSARTLAETLAGLNERTRLELVDAIAARKAWNRDEPVLSLTITHFADGGSALGLSWHHTVGDWHSVMSLLKAWSRTVAGLPYDKPVLVTDRDAHFDAMLPASEHAPSNLRFLALRELPKLGLYMLTRAKDKRRVTFHFEPDELARMRAALERESGQKLSVNDALSGHIATVLAARDTHATDRRVSIAVNFRKRAGLPEQLLCNAVSTLDVGCEQGKSASRIAADLRGALDAYADKHLNHHANQRLIARHGGIAKIARFIPTGVDPFAGSIILSNWSRFGIYEIDFGGQAPSHFLTVGSGPLPWLGTVHEGFRQRGLIVDMELPSDVARRMLDADGLRAVHRYRDDKARENSENQRLSWLS
jgi:shikimate O-hydroxycinnamoyltransferase